MNRRFFLTAAASLASAPTWMSRAFAAADRLPALSQAWQRAHEAGRPLLVLIIPDDDGDKWERGHLFGEWLNHAPVESMAQLALVEMACATLGELKQLVPQVRGAPLMALVETDQVPAAVTELSGEVPPSVFEFGEGEDVIDARIQLMADLLASAVAPDEGTLQRRVAQLRAVHGADELDRVLGDARAGAHLSPDRAGLFGAAVYAVAQTSRRRAPLLQTLSQAAAVRHRTGPPLGAQWATTHGCGVTVEGTDSMGAVGCGMGHVAARSTRFLYFFDDGRPI